MADGHPQFDTLDFGQVGGTRQTAGTALFSGNVMRGADEAAAVDNPLPQQQQTFRDHMGYRGTTFRIAGVIRTSTVAMMNTIMTDLTERKTGSRRNASGVLSAPDPAMLAEQPLTDFDGTVLGNRVKLTDWTQTGRRVKGSEWTQIMPVELRFRSLG